jgi:hypothetical protein
MALSKTFILKKCVKYDFFAHLAEIFNHLAESLGNVIAHHFNVTIIFSKEVIS